MKTDSQRKKERIDKALRKTPFLQAKNSSSGEVAYKKPDDVYFRSPDLHIYFHGDPDTWFLNEGNDEKEWLNLGVEDKPRYLAFKTELPGDIKNQLRNYEGCTREISVVDYSLDGLENFLNKIINESDPELKTKYAQTLWDFLVGRLGVLTVREKNKFLKGVYCWFYYRHRCARFDAAWLKLIRDSAWLPSHDGEFYKPNEISVEQLRSDFPRDTFLVDAIGFKSDEVGIEPEDIELLKALKENPAEYQRVKDVIGSNTRPQPESPTRKSPDSKRRKEKISKELEKAPSVSSERRLKSVIPPPDPITRTYLRDANTNENGEIVCQICKNKMPFKKRNGEYYFEVVGAFSEPSIEYTVEYLALCPLCAAMYKEFIKKDDHAMREFKSKLCESDELEIPIRLGEVKTTVRFVETHFIDIKQFLREDNKRKQNPQDP